MRHMPDGQIRRHSVARFAWIVAFLLVAVLVLAACGGGDDQADAPADEPTAAAEAPAAEEAEEPAEEEATPEAEEEAAEEAEDEAEATPEAAEEGAEEAAADATAEPEEEATAEPEEEATPEAEEEAEATPAAEEEAAEAEATPEAEAEAAEEADAEATAEPEEEATAEPEEEAMGGDAEAGGYLFTIARGCGCHFNRDLEAYAGGLEFEVPNGVVYARNITPDEETGIGSLSEADIAQILQTGSLGDYHLHPIMPYRNYAALSDEDALNLAAYLLSQEPVVNEVPPRDLSVEPDPFTPETEPPATSPTDPVERGEMLVALARCSGCHTPSNEDGSPNMDLFLAGNRINEDEVAWNITPDEETGIGSWSEEELANFLRTGQLADGSEIVGTMATQIERYFSSLTEEDAAAIAAYLKSLPPVENEPE